MSKVDGTYAVAVRWTKNALGEICSNLSIPWYYSV